MNIKLSWKNIKRPHIQHRGIQEILQEDIFLLPAERTISISRAPVEQYARTGIFSNITMEYVKDILHKLSLFWSCPNSNGDQHIDIHDKIVLVIGANFQWKSALASIEQYFRHIRVNSTMLRFARKENPRASIICFVSAQTAATRHAVKLQKAFPDVRFFCRDSDFLPLMRKATKVYVYDSEKAVVALAHNNKPVIVFGNPGYAGRGFTKDCGQAVSKRMPMDFPEWFARKYLLRRYLLALPLPVSISDISFEQLMSILFMSKDDMVYGLFTGNPHAYPDNISVRSPLACGRFLDSPDAAGFKEWLTGILPETPLGELLLCLMRGNDPTELVRTMIHKSDHIPAETE